MSLPTYEGEKENPKGRTWGPVSTVNWALDVTSVAIADLLNVAMPYPTEESVADTRKKMAEQDNADTIDPITGAQYAYRPRNVDGHAY